MKQTVVTTLSIEDLQQIVSKAVAASLKNYIPSPSSVKHIQHSRHILNVEGVCKKAHLSKPTVYRAVQENSIPFFRRAKRLYFYEDEIEQWMHGRNKKD